MRARIDTVMGPYWVGIAQAVEVIAAISTLGALGGLSTLLGALTQYARRFPTAVLLASLIALQGCAPLALRASNTAQPESPNDIRTLGADQRFSFLSSEGVARRVRELQQGEPINVLALSGGGAEGAFGAGALVGLTRSASRPNFSVVTGVSAGALIAPYAFLGSDWDGQLTDTYISGRAEHLLQSRGLGVFFGSSIYRGMPLHDLVDRYVTDELIQAVAREAAGGRLLLVATTDAETGEPVVWDLGSIAMNGGGDARTLFRDVLVASASVPGFFPPVIIRVHEQGALYEEAHVDGAISVPFFVPSAFLGPARGARNPTDLGTIYILVDGRLSENSEAIQLRTRSIVSRSVSTELHHMLRTTLELTATKAALKGEQVQYAALPVAYPSSSPFDFRTSTMRSLFEYGYNCAQAGRLWTSTRPLDNDGGDHAGNPTGQNIPCPVEDDSLGRLVARY